MHRLVCLLLAVLALLSATCDAEDAFVFANGASWVSTAEEVKALLPEGYESAEDFDEGFGAMTILRTENEEFFGHIAAQTDYMFFNDDLLSISCYYLEEDVPDLQLLIDAMSEVYGEPKMYAENELTLDGVISNTRTWCSWNPDSVTEIALYEPLDEYPYRYYIGFRNEMVYQAFNDAVMAWYDSEEITTWEEE